MSIVVIVLMYGLQTAYDTYHPQKSRGRVLIIANSVFSLPKLSKRFGTERDVNSLRAVFKWLGFEVAVRDNLSAQVSNSHQLRMF